MAEKYDIIVIGAGSGGLGVALGMARFGFRVLLIDRSKESFGGECLNTGCVPSKALLHVAGIVKNARDAEAFGLKAGGNPDFHAVMNEVHSRQALIRGRENPQYLEKEEGVHCLIGEASFCGKQEVEVKAKRYQAKRLVVATGSRPRMLKVPGMEQVRVLTNENLFDLEVLPQKLLVVGGGSTGVEMAQAFARLGSKVTLAEMQDRILPKDPPEASAILQQQMEKEGVSFRLNHKLSRFEPGPKAVITDAGGKKEKLECDAVLLSIGRELDYSKLKLEKAGVRLKDGQPTIDKYLRAKGNKRIVFAGDAAQNMFFSHAAELHSSIILTNFFARGPLKKKLNLTHFSWCSFTDPEVCSFGYSEEQLREKAIHYQRIEHSFEADDRAVISGYPYGKLLLFLKKNKLKPRDGKILGGCVIAPRAGEMAQELILANEQGLGAGAIFNKIYPYPVQSRVHKIALVEEFSKHISPAIKKMLKLLYR